MDLLIGLVTGLLLFAEHYGLDHLAPSFRAHPPRAYSVGVGTLFAGYLLWAWLTVDTPPAPAWVTVLHLAVITAGAGAGTWTAYALHGWQQRRAAGRIIRAARAVKGN